MMYALWSTGARNFITYRGHVLIHESREELEFLFPGAKVRRFDGQVDAVMPIKNHPELRHVQWPLRRADFW